MFLRRENIIQSRSGQAAFPHMLVTNTLGRQYRTRSDSVCRFDDGSVFVVAANVPIQLPTVGFPDDESSPADTWWESAFEVRVVVTGASPGTQPDFDTLNTVNWPGGSAPTFPDGRSVVELLTLDGGTSWDLINFSGAHL